jgi:hypothetical protein
MKNSPGASSKAETSASAAGRRKSEQRYKPERKAAVRKQKYDMGGDDSDDTELSDAPSESEAEASAAAGPSGSTGVQSESESDAELEAKLNAAGDGESLLGSADSEDEGGDTAEEERYLIQQAARKEARRQSHAKILNNGAVSKGRGNGGFGDSARGSGSEQRGRTTARRASAGDVTTGTEAPDNEDGEDGEAATAGDKTGERVGRSLSPETMRQLGIDDFEDELFEPQDAFGSSSEPSFTDFFASDSDSDGESLSAHDDDGELTSDGTDSDEISDIEGALVGVPFLAQIGGAEALAAASAAGGTATTDDANAAAVPAEIPLLVIEDLDGRLIYARAGDGEAVFGSDGEFEFLDDSESDSSEDEMLEMMRAQEGPWGHWRSDGAALGGSAVDDEGETTDELGDEDMPFPRLLVGSVAPRGGRNTRRARAMAAAKSRRLSPDDRRRAASSSRLAPTQGGGHRRTHSDQSHLSQLSDTTPLNSLSGGVPSGSGNPFDSDFGVSNSGGMREADGTIEAAARSLGLSVEEATKLLSEVEAAASDREMTLAGPSTNGVPATPLRAPPKPEMGSFMPTSARGVHRAVIDGNKQAPSPFANRHGMQKRGLASASGIRAGKRRHSSRRESTSTLSSKRPRRYSSALHGGEGASEPATSPVPKRIDPMELDDVVDASMLWREEYSEEGSGAEDEDETDEELDEEGSVAGTATQASVKSGDLRPRASSRSSSTAPSISSSTSAATAVGLNLNAFQRWDRIPMGAFRDGQGSSLNGGRQALGTFLLTRSQRNSVQRNGSGSRRSDNHSPFRGRSEAMGIHMGAAPRVIQDASPTGAGADAGEDADAALARRRAAFFVSPILWPVRNGEHGSDGGAPSLADIPQFDLSSTPKGKMTRREKRERKARRAALRAAETAASSVEPGEGGSQYAPSPGPSTPNLGDGGAEFESPASALPRLRITDASPRGSPAPTRAPLRAGPLGAHGDGNGPANGGTNGHGERMQEQQQLQHPLPPSTLSGLTPPMSAMSEAHSVPSAHGVPVYSPLFGGIVSPVTLAFTDDIDNDGVDGHLVI